MFSKRFLIYQITFILSIAILFFLYKQNKPQPLPLLGTVSDFQLKNVEGQDINLNAFKGKVWVANFVFTTCSGICPMMSKHMNQLHQSFKPYQDVKLVSITVNPENDTSDVLKSYAKKFNADTRQWIFLTGSRETITKVVVESFKLGNIKEPIFHSSYFALVDRHSHIRGYYDGTEASNIPKIAKDIVKLLKE